jgi:hypothetical protein
MSSRPARSTISADGLHYTARQTGTPFKAPSASAPLKSCLQCGRHKPHHEGQHLKILGKSTFVCFGCRPKKDQQPAPAR